MSAVEAVAKAIAATPSGGGSHHSSYTLQASAAIEALAATFEAQAEGAIAKRIRDVME